MVAGADAIVRWIADGLLTGSIQGALFIAILWAVCRRIPGIPAPVQAALWWLAALKLLLSVMPVPGISLPLLPAAAEAVRLIPPTPPGTPALAPVAMGSSSIDWVLVVVAVWAIGVLVHAARLIAASHDLRVRVRRSIRPTEEASLAVLELTQLLGLRRVPDVRISGEIAAPLVAGMWRPVVLMPAGIGLKSDELRMALCHELMHVRRRDLALGWVPAITERLFFFHPLARLAAAEYVTAREAACDAAVVRALDVSPEQYGQMLIRLGFARSEPAFAAGGAPASMSSLRRRLDMLRNPSVNTRSRRLSRALVAAATLALVPFQLSAKSPQPQQRPSRPAATSLAQTAQAPPAVQPAQQKQAAPPEQATTPKPESPAADRESTQRRDREARDFEIEARRLMMEAIKAQEQAGDGKPLEEYRNLLLEAQRAVHESLETYRNSMVDARKGLEVQRQAEAQIREQSESLAAQLQALRRQQDLLLQQLRLISDQQEALVRAQQEIAKETQRLREALKGQ